MSQPHYILRPVNPFFIGFSFICAFLLNLLPWGGSVLVPDFVALVLVFWTIHQPRKVGIGWAFAMGLIMDVHGSVYLGENALAFTLLSYSSITIHRRVQWFGMLSQMGHVFPLFLLSHVIQLGLRFIVAKDASFSGLSIFLPSLMNALLWPLVTWVLLAPQRRPIDKDDTRPI